MKISVIQMNSQDDKAKNIADAEALIRKAVSEDKSDLVVLPETFTYMGGTVESRRAHAETFPDGEAYRAMSALAAELKACADWAVGVASVEEIDRLGLGRAADLAMIRAVEGLPRPPAFALIDGRRVPPGLPCPSGWLIKGDARSVSIAAASILAKTERDAEMDRLAVLHPEYGWEANRGYGAPAHIAALKLWGVTPHHRRSFRPIHNILVEESRPTD